MNEDFSLAQLHLLSFSPALREAAVEDAEFLAAAGIRTSSTATISKVSFDSAALFEAVRAAFKSAPHGIELAATDGRIWKLGIEVNEHRFVLQCEDVLIEAPDFSSLSPDASYRREWFSRKSSEHEWNDGRSQAWQQRLEESALSDGGLDELFRDFKLTPLAVRQNISAVLRQGDPISVETLVPANITYYERLIGPLGENASLNEFAENTVAAQKRDWSSADFRFGLYRLTLLSAHHRLLQGAVLDRLSLASVIAFYEWLIEWGDRYSQLGGIEIGLSNLDVFPELESHILRLAKLLMADDPGASAGRWGLAVYLIMFVDGELARTRIAKNIPPFWRRLASIAHASVLEREFVQAGIPTAMAIEMVSEMRGRPFYAQSLVDLRREPRWQPEMLNPQQLKAECLGRVASAALTNGSKIKSSELKAALCEPHGGQIRKFLEFPFPYLPGPLEGNVASELEVPTELETILRKRLSSDTLDAESFTILINLASLFVLDTGLVELASSSLRRVRFQLRESRHPEALIALLLGLASVSSVSRNPALAEDVRALTHVALRTNRIIDGHNLVRIACLTASAFADTTQWRVAIGEFFTELAFEELTHEQASIILARMRDMLRIEPRLWETCSRAEAALAAFAGLEHQREKMDSWS